MKKIKIGKKIISKNLKTYFIADIGANHDGNLGRAKKLIRLCAKAGADRAIRPSPEKRSAGPAKKADPRSSPRSIRIRCACSSPTRRPFA